MKFTKAERVFMRGHPEVNERWLQDRIGEDPAILGLGKDLVLLNKEIIQPKAGRLDLLLGGSPGSSQRYEVEIQLGRTDESHIIRTLEYWDIERKRYPQYDHTAVIVAEDVTSRFLNVISLFNGFIPLINLQVAALQVTDYLVLQFTKVLDQVQLGVDEVDPDGQPASRADWEQRSSREVLAIVDDFHSIIKELDQAFELKYNKQFIALARNGKPDNFVVFQPRKQWLRVGLALTQSDDNTAALERAGLKPEYDPKWHRYGAHRRIRHS